MKKSFVLIVFLIMSSLIGITSISIVKESTTDKTPSPITSTTYWPQNNEQIAIAKDSANGGIYVSEGDIIAGNLTDHGWVMRQGQLLYTQTNFTGFTVARWSKDESHLFVVVANYSDNGTQRIFSLRLWRVNVTYFWVNGTNVGVEYEEVASFNMSLNNTNTPLISDMDAVILDNGTMILAVAVTMMDWVYKIKYSYMYVFKYSNVSEVRGQFVQIDYIDHLGSPPNVYLYFSIGLELSVDGNETALNMALGYYYTSSDGSTYVIYGVLLIWYGEVSRKYDFAFFGTTKIKELSNLVLFDNISVVAMSVYVAQYDLDVALVMSWNITANSTEEDAVGFGPLNLASDYFDLFGENPEFKHIGLGVYNNSTALWFVAIWEAHTDSEQYILYGTTTYYYAYDNSSGKYGIHMEIGELGIVTQSFRALQFMYADADIFDKRGSFLYVDYDIQTASYQPRHLLYALNDTGNVVWFGPFLMDVTTKRLPKYDLAMFNSRNIFGIAQTSSENASEIYPIIIFRDLDRDYLGDWEETNVYSTDPARPDSDGDGLNDGSEIHKYNTNPLSADTDSDGLDDKFELEIRTTTIYEEYGNITNLYLTNPLSNDTDGDNITDYLEVTGNYTVDGHPGYKTDPTRKDTDGDGLSDYEEVFVGFEYWVNQTSNRFVVYSDPTLRDSDFDNITDKREVLLELNPMSNDTDGDGLLDLDERQIYKTSPHIFDTDKDLLSDYEEVNIGTNPLRNDTDGDGLSDGEEVKIYMTSPLQKDTDGDGLEDGQEVHLYSTDPLKNDTDGDNLEDSLEILEYNTDPLSNDTDGDGLSDYEEVKGVYIEGLNKTVRLDPLSNDTDGDGLSDYEEVKGFAYGSGTVHTDPALWDTDGDGLSDSYELTFSNTSPALWDTDGDGLGDGSEVLEYGTNPLVLDTDGDNLSDYEEIFGVNITGIGVLSLNPLTNDSDRDNVSDYYEAKIYNTNPLKNDTDGDGLSDYFEIYLSWNVTLILNGSSTIYSVSSDPLNYDSDGDGLNDYEEYLMKSDPNLLDTDSDNLTDSEEYYIGTSLVSTDTDGDGLSDYEEYVGIYIAGIGNVTLSPTNNDTDGDNLDDFSEARVYLTDPTSSDTDRDGIGDYQEVFEYGTNPRSSDTDGDGLEDLEEIELYGTNPLLNDTDGDGLSDGDEIFGIQIGDLGFRKMDPLNNDTDGDGLSDYEEARIYLTDPTKSDSDGDGLVDSVELSLYSTDPLDLDTDNDGLSDGEEVVIHSDPLLNDTDGDGLSDYEEYVKFGTYPTKSDSDGDGLSDGEEIELSTNPLMRDTDGDGLSDYEEVKNYRTDPLKVDTDGDGLSDWAEIKAGSDPLKVDTDGDGLSDYEEVEVRGTDPTSRDTDGDLIPDPVDLVFPSISDWFLILAVVGTALLYSAYSYGMFRNWKNHVIAAGLSDLGGILMFAIPEEFKDRYNASLISSGLLGIQTLTGEIVGKQTETLILSGEIPVFIRRGAYTIFWVFLKKTYPRLIRALESIHRELEEEFEPVLSSWSGMEEEVEEVKYWLASKLEIKGLPARTISVEEEFEKVFEE